MLRVAIIGALLAAAGCASSGASAQVPACAWDIGAWATEWEGGAAVLTLALAPDGVVRGRWETAEGAAGLVWGRVAGPENGTLVGEWGGSVSDPVSSAGGFLFQRVASDDPALCRFEGVYTTVSEAPPMYWNGERRSP